MPRSRIVSAPTLKYDLPILIAERKRKVTGTNFHIDPLSSV